MRSESEMAQTPPTSEKNLMQEKRTQDRPLMAAVVLYRKHVLGSQLG